MKCPKCGLTKLVGNGMPTRNMLFKLVEQSYEQPAARKVGDWDLVAESPTLKLYRSGNDVVVSIRGTYDAEDAKADGLIAFNGLESSTRFQKDLRFLDSFQKQNPGLQYFGVGHSLGGAVLDLFLHKGMITQGQSYNPAVQPHDFSTTLPNNRIFMSGDPLYTLVRAFLKQKPEVIQEKSSIFRKIARLTPIGNVLTSGDYLKSHGLAQFEGKGKGGKKKLKPAKYLDPEFLRQEEEEIATSDLQLSNFVEAEQQFIDTALPLITQYEADIQEIESIEDHSERLDTAYNIATNEAWINLLGDLIADAKQSYESHEALNIQEVNRTKILYNRLMAIKERLTAIIEGFGEGGSKTHKQNVLKKLRLKDTGHSVSELSEVSGVPEHILQEVYNRGIGAYTTNPESVRIKGTFKKGPAPMSQKLSKEQWAMARVYSFLDGNPKHDQDLIN